MRPLIPILVVAAAVFPSAVLACSYSHETMPGPEEDLGFVEGRSPEPPIILGGTMFTCENAGDCCRERVELVLSAPHATLFLVQIESRGGFYLRPEQDTLRFFPGARTPLALQVIAFDSVGYRSRPTAFTVQDSEPFSSGGGCRAVGGDGSILLLALPLLLQVAARLRPFTRAKARPDL
jgi:hypothetical protein